MIHKYLKPLERYIKPIESDEPVEQVYEPDDGILLMWHGHKVTQLDAEVFVIDQDRGAFDEVYTTYLSISEIKVYKEVSR